MLGYEPSLMKAIDIDVLIEGKAMFIVVADAHANIHILAYAPYGNHQLSLDVYTQCTSDVPKNNHSACKYEWPKIGQQEQVPCWPPNHSLDQDVPPRGGRRDVIDRALRYLFPFWL